MSNLFPENVSIPKPLVDKMLDTIMRQSTDKGHRDERTEIVCRLLASGMSVDEIYLILQVPMREINAIKDTNERTIYKYAQTLSTRKKKREKRAPLANPE